MTPEEFEENAQLVSGDPTWSLTRPMSFRAIASVAASVAASVMLITVAYSVTDALVNQPVEEVAQR